MLQRISMFYFFLIVWTVNVRSGKKGTFFRRCNKEFTLLYWNILRWCLVLLGDFGAQSPKILQKGRNLFFLVRKQAELLKESPVVIFQEVTFLWFCLHVSSPVTTWAWYTVFWDHLNIWYVLIWRQIFFPCSFSFVCFWLFLLWKVRLKIYLWKCVLSWLSICFHNNSECESWFSFTHFTYFYRLTFILFTVKKIPFLNVLAYLTDFYCWILMTERWLCISPTCSMWQFEPHWF